MAAKIRKYSSAPIDVTYDRKRCIHAEACVRVHWRRHRPGRWRGRGTRDAEGAAGRVETETWLCRCGHSQTKPFCDGSHSKAGFTAD